MKDIKELIFDFVIKIVSGNELVVKLGDIMVEVVIFIKCVNDIMFEIVVVFVE